MCIWLEWDAREYNMANRGKRNGKGKRDLIKVDRVGINSTACKQLLFDLYVCYQPVVKSFVATNPVRTSR